MFCLRSWIPILFFLYVPAAPDREQMANVNTSTNASPIYLILFISATYILNRPCVYCSLLLAILVVALFDFHGDWFEPRYLSATTLSQAGNATHTSSSYNASFGFLDSLSLFGS